MILNLLGRCIYLVWIITCSVISVGFVLALFEFLFVFVFITGPLWINVSALLNVF